MQGKRYYLADGGRRGPGARPDGHHVDLHRLAGVPRAGHERERPGRRRAAARHGQARAAQAEGSAAGPPAGPEEPEAVKLFLLRPDALPNNWRQPREDFGEFYDLVDDIRRHGQRVPIIVRDNRIVDGRKRARACEVLGKMVEAIDFADAEELARDTAPKALNANERALRAAEEAQHEAGYHWQPGDPPTTGKAAADYGVDKSTVLRAKRVMRAGAPEVIAALRADYFSLSAAEHLVRLRPRHEDQI